MKKLIKKLIKVVIVFATLISIDSKVDIKAEEKGLYDYSEYKIEFEKIFHMKS